MNLTFDEIAAQLDNYLELSDFNYWYGKENDLLRFAEAIIKLEKEKENVLAAS